MKRLSLMFAAIALLAGSQQASADYAKSSLNLRTGAGTNYPVITVIPYCGKVQVYARNYGWCNVKYGKYTGWASCKYLVSYCGGGGGYGGGGYSGGGSYGGGSYGGGSYGGGGYGGGY